MVEASLLLPPGLATAVAARLVTWRAMDGTKRLWATDATLWTGADEAKWLGWLDAVGAVRAALPGLTRLAAEVKAEGTRHVGVLGMGGSSLCPYVLAGTFVGAPGSPVLHVLDSTDPAQIRTFESGLDLARTIFVVSSKSGSTLEPNILRDYFLARMRESLGAEAARRFIAVTDPGSQLESQAKADGFRAILPGVPSIGGRFSALSNFGMVPAALGGLDIAAWLSRAEPMVQACRENDPARNPGVRLGAVMGEAAAQGRDKLTIIPSAGLNALGSWLEQLVAESTGKHGRGVIPVAGEAVAPPDRYGSDRLFVHVRLEDGADPGADAAVDALAAAGHAVVRIPVEHTNAIAAEFFRWELATAVCGSVMGINPFDQPDVEASKIATRKLTDEVERTGALPPEEPFHVERGIKLYADRANAQALTTLVTQRTFAGFLRAHLGRLRPGDYAAILAYVEMNEAHEDALQAMRHRIRDAAHVATTLGFGPRFLHSTGQAHKGGPNTGVFLQITCDDARDLPVPGRRYSFGTVKAAQARGDFAVLEERGRRALRVHLGSDVPAGLTALGAAIEQALT